MKCNFFLFGIILGALFAACRPDFNLNAPHKEVTVVYGILDYKDSIHYVKIYRGFQSQAGEIYIDARHPDSIYHKKDEISVVLQEYDENDKRTPRHDIPLSITHNFPRDSGIFYYDKEKIIYYTAEELFPDNIYKIVITNNITKNIIEGKTSIVGDFMIRIISSTLEISHLNRVTTSSVPFNLAKNAAKKENDEFVLGCEFHVNFLYFEVDKNTNQVVKTGRVNKNITPQIGGRFEYDPRGDNYIKYYSKTFFDDIAAQITPNANVIRYPGTPNKPGVCIEIEGWAAGQSLFDFLLSNKPTSSFVQINTKYTNLTTNSDELVFGFLSSRFQCPKFYCTITQYSEDSLVKGNKTNQLGFRYWIEYKP
jgi:hypothetical protein